MVRPRYRGTDEALRQIKFCYYTNAACHGWVQRFSGKSDARALTGNPAIAGMADRKGAHSNIAILFHDTYRGAKSWYRPTLPDHDL